MAKPETIQQRSERILGKLRTMYPGANAFDVDGRGQHFACEVEPTSYHPEYDLAVEIIVSTLPHKHLKSSQKYTVIEGELELHVDDQIVILKPNDTYTVLPGKVHWSKSPGECLVEEVSRPGWTKEDHIAVP